MESHRDMNFLLGIIIYISGCSILLWILIDLLTLQVSLPPSNIHGSYDIYYYSTFWLLKDSGLSGYELFIQPRTITLVIGSCLVYFFAILTKYLDNKMKTPYEENERSIKSTSVVIVENIFTIVFLLILFTSYISYYIKQAKYTDTQASHGLTYFYYFTSIGIFWYTRSYSKGHDTPITIGLVFLIFQVLIMEIMMFLLTSGD